MPAMCFHNWMSVLDLVFPKVERYLHGKGAPPGLQSGSQLRKSSLSLSL